VAKPKLNLETVQDLRAIEMMVGHRVFYPMSHDAQDVLVIIASRLNRRTNAPAIAKSFASQYVQASYEDAVLKWDKPSLCKLLKDHKTWAVKTDDALLRIATLAPLTAHEWSIPSVPYGARISNNSDINDIYDYLTQNFLVANFAKSDLHTIITLNQSGIGLSDIKSACILVKVPDKRTIAYVAAICQNENKKEEGRRAQRDEVDQKSSETLKRYLNSIEGPSKVKHQYDPNWLDDIELTRLMREDQNG
jgi:hypothetical protein